MKKYRLILFIIMFFLSNYEIAAQAVSIPFPKIGINVGTAESGEDVSVTLQLLLLMTIHFQRHP